MAFTWLSGFSVDGNVGIGEDNPSTKLYIDSVSTFPTLTLARSTTHSGISFTAGISNFSGAGADLLIDGVGNDTGFGFRTRNSSGTQINALILDPSGNATFAGDLTVGDDIIIEGNELTFKSAGAAFIDHNTVGNSIKFRLSSSSSLDVIPLEITPSYVAFLDVPIVGTMTAGNNTTRAASTAFVTSAVATGVGDYLPLAGGTMTAGAVVTFLDSSGSTDDRLKFGSGGDMQLFHDGTASHIVSSGSDLRIDVPNFIVRSASGTESIIRATQNAAVELYYDNSKKFETTDLGVTFSNLATTSASTPSTPVDEVKIGTFGAGRPALFLGTSDTTYSNSTWFIENIGASGKFRIGRNGLDVIEISNSGNTTFAGKVMLGSGTPVRKLELRNITGARNFGIGFNDKDGTQQATTALDHNTNDLVTASTANMRFFTGSTIGDIATLPTNQALVLTSSQNARFTAELSSNTIISRDNMYVDAGQLYIGSDGSTTDNSYRQVVSTSAGSFKLQKRISGTFTDVLGFDNLQNATFGTQAFATTATSSGDASSTLTTKGYVDGLITGATIYRGTWQAGISATSSAATTASTTLTVTAAILDVDNNTPVLVGAVVTGAGITGTVKVSSVTSATVYELDTAIDATATAYIFSPIYGAPDLSGVTQTSGYYYICSEAGSATPNGAGTEPNTWSVGDWAIWNDDVGASGEWQKIDNSSVLSGAGTGQTVALWEGASSVTDSETLGNAPITVIGNNTTFAGTITSGNITINGSSRALVVKSSNDQVVASFVCDGNAISTIGFKGNTGANDYNVRIGADGSSLVAYTVNTVRMTINSSGNTTFTGSVTASNFTSTGTSQFNDTVKIEKPQLTNQFDTSSFLRLHPSSTINSSGYTNMIFGTSTVNNFGVAIGAVRAGTGDTSTTNNPAFTVRILNDSVIGTEVLRINTAGNATFVGTVAGTTARFDTLNNSANSANIIYRSGTDTIVGNNANALVVEDGGNVGIGTDGPNHKLDVLTSIDQQIPLRIKNSDADSHTYMRFEDNDGQYWDTGINYANNDYYLKYGGTVTARFTNAGGLDVYGTGNSILTLNPGTTAGNYSALNVGRTDGAGTAHVTPAVTGGVPIGGIAGILFGSTNTSLPAVAIQTPNSASGHIVFKPKGAEMVRIQSDGNVGIGITSNINAPLTIQADGSAGAINIVGRSNGVYDESIVSFYDYDQTTRKGYILNSAGNMYFATGGSTEHMTIDSAGSVAIGTFTPSGTPTGDYRSLEIGRQGNTITGAPWKSNLYFSTNATITAASTAFTYRYASELPTQMVMEDGIWTFSNAVAGTVGSTITFTERMRISTTGAIKFNAYDGTNQTGSPTHILGTDASGNVVKSTAGSSIGPWLPLAAGSGDPLTGTLYINPGTADNTSYDALVLTGGANSTSGSGAKMYLTGTVNDPISRGTIIEGLMTDNSNAHALVFSTSGASAAPTERVRITSTGHLQVSTGYFELTSQPTTKLWLSTNQVQLYAGNLLVFGGYNSSNDAVVIGNESGDINVTLAGGPNDKVLYLEGSSGNVGIGTKTLNRSGLGIDHKVLTVGRDTEMGMLELQGTRTSDADLGRIAWLNAGTRLSEIVVSRVDEDTSTKMAFWTSNAGSLGSRMTIAKDGNVGIGVTGPIYKLVVAKDGGTIASFQDTTNSNGVQLTGYSGHIDIKGYADTADAWVDLGIRSSAGTQLYLKTDGNVGIGTDSPGANLEIFKSSGPSLLLTAGGSGTAGFKITKGDSGTAYINNVDNVSMQFQIANGTKMIIASGGNVSIGTTSTSSYKLEVAGNVGIGFATGNKIVLTSQSGFQDSTLESHIISANGLGGFGSGDLLIQPRCSNVGANSIIFGTSNSTNTAAERVRITSSGKLGINSTNPGRMLEVNGGTTDDGGIKLTTANTTSNYWSGIEFSSTVATSFIYMSADDADGTLQFLPDASLKGSLSKAGTWTVAADVVAYGSPSDERLKENIKPIDSALDKVMKLKGVTFDWIQKEDQILNIKEDIGFIAQDVQKVIPELVRENEDGMLSMRHQGMAPILLEAIKELKAEIEDLKKKIK